MCDETKRPQPLTAAAQLFVWFLRLYRLEPPHLSSVSHLAAPKNYPAAPPMIRRDPTLIPVSDLEIQDIRELYNKQKADREKQDELLRKIKIFSQNPELLKDDPQMLEYLNKLTSGKQKEKKQEEKTKRLGLDKGGLMV